MIKEFKGEFIHILKSDKVTPQKKIWEVMEYDRENKAWALRDVMDVNNWKYVKGTKLAVNAEY